MLDSVRFYPAFKADLTRIARESGITKQKILEDAVAFYFGDRTPTLLRRRVAVTATVAALQSINGLTSPELKTFRAIVSETVKEVKRRKK